MHAPIVTSINHAATIWATWIINAAWQATLLALVAMLALRLGRRWPAPLRAALLLVALVKFLTPPTLPSPIGAFRFAEPVALKPAPAFVAPPDLAAPAASAADLLGVGPRRETQESARAHHEAVAGDRAAPPADFATTASVPAIAVAGPARQSLTVAAILMLIHAAGTCAVLLWLATGVARLRRLARGATVLRHGPLYDRMRALARRLGIHAPRELLISAAPVPPVAFGVFRRHVMLPTCVIDTLSPVELDAIVAHELAHHARRDTLVTALQWLVLAVWWFNPVAWLLARALRHVREECCDDVVLSARVVAPIEYCRTILAAAERLVAHAGNQVRRPYAAALAVAEPMHPIGSRMRRILEPGWRPARRLRPAAWAAVLLAGVVMLPGVATWPVAARADAPTADAPTADAPTADAPTADADSAPAKAAVLGELPEDFAVYAVGTYAGPGDPEDVQLDESGHEVRRADVVVNMPDRPVVLVLTAYDPTVWRVGRTPNTRIAGVIVSGYHGQALIGIEKNTPQVISTHDQEGAFPCFYAYKASPRLLAMNKAVNRIVGRELDSFVNRPQRNGIFYIGERPKDEANIVYSDDLTVAQYAVKPRAVPAGTKGLEQLVREGKLRPATPDDVEAWVENASKKYRRFNRELRVEAPMRPEHTYVVLGEVTLPEGLFGAHSRAFILPDGAPFPKGPTGHSRFYRADGTEEGPMARLHSDD